MPVEEDLKKAKFNLLEDAVEIIAEIASGTHSPDALTDLVKIDAALTALKSIEASLESPAS